jgi:ubiquinone biosynthesis protein UbiJ
LNLIIEPIINQAIPLLDKESLEALKKLSGKIIRFELNSININKYIFFDNQTVMLLNQYEGEADVYISTTPFTLLRLLVETETSANDPDMKITGDISIAQNMFYIIKNLDWEWKQKLKLQLPTAIVNRAEMESFLNQVDTLRDDFERLEQRVQKLT